MNVRQLYKTLCSTFGVTVDDLLGRSQCRHAVTPRQVGMYLAKELGESYRSAAWIFNRTDHTTALNAHDKIRAKKAIDREFSKTVDKCRAKVESVWWEGQVWRQDQGEAMKAIWS